MYETKQLQTWDMIAKEVYGDECEVGILMENNKEYLDTFIFNSGVLLRTPAITSEYTRNLPPWSINE